MKQGLINKKGYFLGEPENNAFSNLMKNKKIIKSLCLSKPEDIQKANIINSMGITYRYNQNLIHKKNYLH